MIRERERRVRGISVHKSGGLSQWKKERKEIERGQFIREMGISVNKTYIDRWINEQKRREKEGERDQFMRDGDWSEWQKNRYTDG